MAVKEAAQRCPQGVYVPDDPARYGEAFAAVLEVLDRFSPVVEDAGVGLAFADGAGLEALYGPDEELGARVRREVEAATGQAAQIGLAAGRLAAEVAARTAGDAGVAVVSGDDRAYLAEQPVQRLPLDARAVGHLRMLGIGTIGAFAELPANAVRTRYGVEGARARRLARGEDPQPLKGRPRPIVLDESIDFEWEEHNVDRLTFALQALAQRLAKRLSRRGLMAQQVGSRIERADGTVQRFSLDLPEASGSAVTLRDAARWRLEAWAGDVQRDFCVTLRGGCPEDPSPPVSSPRTAEPASPPGEGKVPDGACRGLPRRRFCLGMACPLTQIDTPTVALPEGEGERAAPHSRPTAGVSQRSVSRGRGRKIPGHSFNDWRSALQRSGRQPAAGEPESERGAGDSVAAARGGAYWAGGAAVGAGGGDAAVRCWGTEVGAGGAGEPRDQSPASAAGATRRCFGGRRESAGSPTRESVKNAAASRSRRGFGWSCAPRRGRWRGLAGGLMHT